MGELEILEQKAKAASSGSSSDQKRAASDSLDTKASGGVTNSLDLILDLPMQVSVQIGATRMLIRELLQLGQGSVIELDKMAGEPMDVLVNNKLVARGEVVVVNDKFGIRLTDVASPTERVQQLS